MGGVAALCQGWPSCFAQEAVQAAPGSRPRASSSAAGTEQQKQIMIFLHDIMIGICCSRSYNLSQLTRMCVWLDPTGWQR